MGYRINQLVTRIEPWIELTRVKTFAGSMLMFWPYAWALTMAAKNTTMPLHTYAKYMLLGFIGASVHHSGGCVWNDIIDKDLDKKVARTKHRPIADGRISVRGALLFTAVHIAFLLRLIWNLDLLAWYLGLAAIFPTGLTYPFMKRFTFWPQAFLGIAVNFGSIIAWPVARGDIPPQGVVLALGCWSWTVFYDTIYGCQDKKDDVSAGVKSTALLFGADIKPILSLFGGAVICSLLVSGVMNNQSWVFFLVSAAMGGSYLASLLWEVNPDIPEQCLATFNKNAFTFGFIVWSGILADYLMSI
ncbi:4-hydroxybenzoate polyprenyl transferase [Agrocybe pediades]|nr:4-hydroxybenzoate polyprenyl transferase [Agrocybe pediades]